MLTAFIGFKTIEHDGMSFVIPYKSEDTHISKQLTKTADASKCGKVVGILDFVYFVGVLTFVYFECVLAFTGHSSVSRPDEQTRNVFRWGSLPYPLVNPARHA